MKNLFSIALFNFKSHNLFKMIRLDNIFEKPEIKFQKTSFLIWYRIRCDVTNMISDLLKIRLKRILRQDLLRSAR